MTTDTTTEQTKTTMNPKDSAFPVVAESSSEVHFGLTKREYIAVHLFAAMICNSASGPNKPASWAVNAADELIVELSKSIPN